ncbi:hypothetical protein [Halostella pelagica]|uniref:hypothetical protein n=1 Tax=Halostella pelagica TaxID=2583824 RepID=UPI00108185FE|nr:hypothetical protein [Halostella pelagica]
MSSSISDAERVNLLLSGSKSFEEIAEDFEDEIDCYYNLQNAAKTHLRSFEKYLRFYEVCIDQGPTGFVYSRLNRNAERSLKNMVVRGSDAGKRFPINSLSELDNRVKGYQDLGLNGLTTGNVVSTILEHIYTEREDSVYEICDNLLHDSNQPIMGKKLLVHARFISVTTSVDRDTEAFEYYLSEFLSDLPDPHPEDERSADELWERSEEAAYVDTEKLKLAQSSVVRQPAERRLAEYLYLDARDTVERYRHGQRKPKRAELQLCSHQIRLLQGKFSEIFTEEQNTRMRSYLRVVLGQESSGNWWASQQDANNRPDPNYRQAATHFYRAAQIIKPIDRNRFLKYFSKAVRNAATAAIYENYGSANGWEVSLQLHNTAMRVLSSLGADGDAKATETVDESIALHRCLGSRADAVLACYEGDPERIRESVNEAWQVLKTGEVPVHINTDFLKALDIIADAIEYKVEGAFADSVGEFESIEITEELLPTEQPKSLEKIKSYLMKEEYRDALEIAEKTFKEGSPIRTAVEILAGEEAHTPRLTEEYTYPIIGVSDASIWSLAMVTEFIQGGDEVDSEVADQLEKLVLEL